MYLQPYLKTIILIFLLALLPVIVLSDSTINKGEKHKITLHADDLKQLSERSNINFIALNKEVANLEKQGLTLNAIKNKQGKPLIHEVVDKLIANVDSYRLERNLYWLLNQPVELSKRNKAHYIDNEYLRYLADITSKNSRPIDATYPKNKQHRQGLNQLLKSKLESVGIKGLEVFILEGLLPKLPTGHVMDKLNTIQSLRIACYYSDNQGIWEWIKAELAYKDSDDVSTVFEACGQSATLARSLQGDEDANARMLWFKDKSPSLANRSWKNVNNNEKESASSFIRKLSDYKTWPEAIELLETTDITALPESGVIFNRLHYQLTAEIFEKHKVVYFELIDRLIEKGVDPLAPVMTNYNYSYLELLSYTQESQEIYDHIYKQLSFWQKRQLWDAPFIRYYNFLYIAPIKTPLLIQMGLVWAVTSFTILLIAVLLHFRRVKHSSYHKQIIPAAYLQFPFWLGLVVFIMLLLQLLWADSVITTTLGYIDELHLSKEILDVSYPLPWNIWVALHLLSTALQIIAIIILFRKSVLTKVYSRLPLLVAISLFMLLMCMPYAVKSLLADNVMIIFPALGGFI